MRIRQWMFATILAALSVLPGRSATISVSASATPDGGMFDYVYQFSIAGAGANIDNIFLGSDDISPLNVVLEVNGQAAAGWSWLGNDTPQDYLQFFGLPGTALGNGDVLDVTFSSPLVPQATHFAVGLDSATGSTTNRATALLAPSSAAGVPEPGSLGLLAGALAALLVRRRHV